MPKRPKEEWPDPMPHGMEMFYNGEFERGFVEIVEKELESYRQNRLRRELLEALGPPERPVKFWTDCGDLEPGDVYAHRVPPDEKDN